MVRLTKLSLTYRTVVLLLSLLTIGVGVYAAGALKQELLPSIDLPRASILSTYPGASPDVVEAQLSKPIESAVKAVDGVTAVTSKSSSGVSQVTAEWGYGMSREDMATKIRAAIDSLPALPPIVEPRVFTGGTDDIPVVVVALSSDKNLAELSNQVDDVVAPALKTVAGVRDVSVAGQEKREVVITYSQKKIEALGVDPAVIGQLFGANSTAIPSGTIRTDTANFDVQTGSTYSSEEEIADLLVPGTDDPVRLGDIATVVEQPVETTNISRVNGQTALTLTVTKNAEANTVTVANGITKLLETLPAELGSNATFALVFEQAPYIEKSIKDLILEGGIGLVMAVLVILIFLGSVRPTLITAISIPLSLLVALIGLFAGGYTLNILTLGALTVAIGRVVDDSIVVIENIKRHQRYGEVGRASIVNAVKEVAGAITSSTLTTVAVFLPIGLVGGQAGAIFRPFAVTVVVSLIASLFISLTVVPVLASWFMRPTAKQAAQAAQAEEAEKETLLQRAYFPVLNWALHRRWLTLGIALAIFAGTLALAPQLKTDFIGSSGDESLMINQELPAGTALAETDAAAARVEALLKADPNVKAYSTIIGGSTNTLMGTQADTNEAVMIVPLKAGSSAKVVADRLRLAITDQGDSVGNVEIAIGSGGPSAATGVALIVESPDPDKLSEANKKVVDLLESVPGLTNVTSDLTDAREQLTIDLDEAKAAEFGMTQASIGQAVARAVRGQQIGTLTQGDTTLSVYLRSQAPVKSLPELREITLPVTPVMNGKAKSDAADEVTRRSEKLQADGKRSATDSYNDQVKALKKSKANAQKAVRSLTRQINKAKGQLSNLQKQIAAIPSKCQTNPSDPDCFPVPGGIFRLSQQIGAVASQIGALSGGLAQSKAGISAVDKQLDGVAEGRTKSLEAQAKQEVIADAGKAAGEATADPIKLKAVADVKVVEAPAMITRVEGARAATVSASLESSDLGATTAQISDGLAALDLPEGVTVRIGGVSAQQTDSFSQLALAMLVAVFVVYLIMVVTFGSLLQPLILLVSVPFAATGALGLSLITDTPVSVPSLIGLLLLIGIVVTNAIVLIDLINQKRKGGLGVAESIQAGARLRLRPIIMTALATVFALVPLALGLTGGGVFISKPLAIVVIGGLISSTLLTLILVPVLYDILETWRERRGQRKPDRRAAHTATADAPAEA
ncbi:MAG: efflux RND transporter permease subunit [Propionicimonas sp.]